MSKATKPRATALEQLNGIVGSLDSLTARHGEASFLGPVRDTLLDVAERVATAIEILKAQAPAPVHWKPKHRCGMHGKVRYRDRVAAERAMFKLMLNLGPTDGKPLNVFQCLENGDWHVGHTTPTFSPTGMSPV